MNVVTLDEARDYLGIDYDDDMVDANLRRCIKTADMFLKGSIGDNYPVEDPRSKEIALVVIADLYENRSYTTPSVSNSTRNLINSLSLQLRLELARGVFTQ